MAQEDMLQFITERLQKLEYNHGIIKLKIIQDEKDLFSLKEQTLMLKGSIEKLKAIYEEWLRYNKDTQNIRIEEAKKSEQAVEKEKTKSSKKGSRKRKSNNAARKKKKTI